jgi:hypothetical protein
MALLMKGLSDLAAKILVLDLVVVVAAQFMSGKAGSSVAAVFFLKGLTTGAKLLLMLDLGAPNYPVFVLGAKLFLILIYLLGEGLTKSTTIGAVLETLPEGSPEGCPIPTSARLEPLPPPRNSMQAACYS